MRFRTLGSLGLVLIVLVIAFETAAAEDEISFALSADYYGKYIWRGQNLDDDPVFQPSISASYSGLTAGIWGSLETTNYNDNAGDFTEVDYSIDYCGDVPGLEGVGFSVGVIYYDFPSTEVKDTTELYWGLGLSAPLNPSITLYHDIDEADGVYALLGLGHTIEHAFELGLGTPVAIEIGASLGWADSTYNTYYWGLDSSKANDLAMSLAFPFETSGWMVSPRLTYVTLVSNGLRDADTYSKDSDYLFAGIGLGTNF